MNKQELIEKYEKLEGVCKDPGAEIARLIFLENLRGLDEPQRISEISHEKLISSLNLKKKLNGLKL